MKNVEGKIILVDKERYEKELFEYTLNKLRYKAEIKFFDKAHEALDYLKRTKDEIFLILCNYHLAQVDGLSLKEAIDRDEKLKEKCIPFIYSSVHAERREIECAYKESIQGFFIKPYGIDETAKIMDVIIKYWIINKHPNEKENIFEKHS